MLLAYSFLVVIDGFLALKFYQFDEKTITYNVFYLT